MMFEQLEGSRRLEAASRWTPGLVIPEISGKIPVGQCHFRNWVKLRRCKSLFFGTAILPIVKSGARLTRDSVRISLHLD